MDINEIAHMSDEQLVDLVAGARPEDEAVALLALALANDTWFEGVSELRRRYSRRVENTMSLPEDRHPTATSVSVDPDRWKAFWFRRRINLVDVGPMIGRSAGFGSVCAHKGRVGYYSLDELATELGMNTDDLVYSVGTDYERQRVELFG